MKEASSGRWQRRWFEIVSHYLVYYKTKDDVKMLCAMDLWLVGEGGRTCHWNEPVDVCVCVVDGVSLWHRATHGYGQSRAKSWALDGEGTEDAVSVTPPPICVHYPGQGSPHYPAPGGWNLLVHLLGQEPCVQDRL